MKGWKKTMENEEFDLVEGVDEEGNSQLLRVNRYFYYNGEEYVLLSDDTDRVNPNLDEVTFYVMKVTEGVDEDGEEIETFEAVEPELMDALLEVVRTNFSSSAKAGEEEV